MGWAIPVEADGLTYVALTLYGDDPTTEAIDGMLSGQTFSLALHLAATDTVLGFDMNNELVSFDGWTNTNGAPLAAYSDASTTYDFDLTDDCLDASACNFHPASDSNDDCLYPEPAYDCEGNCLDDVDGDGICDPFEVPGCTIANACNFNPEATDDDGSCATLDECGVCGGSGIAEGDCDCAGNQLDAVNVCGGSCIEDLDSDGICDDVDPCVGALDACGVCNGPGEIYECGCSFIPEGDCDCNGNQLDALGVCGGECPADIDADGLCDDVDPCVGALDACGVCNGPGAVYACGCTGIPEGDCDCDGNALDECGTCGGNGIPEGDCDCNGNQLDALGVCGGSCMEDIDGDGVCDDVDPCVGALDACGVCNGPGAIYACGCDGIPEGDCDCEGNVSDALGVCGGSCPSDYNGNGVCDDAEVYGCTYVNAPNYEPEATADDGSCVVVDCDACDEDLDEDGVCDDEDDCVGELDECGVCNGPGAVYDCGCQIWPANDCDCDGNQLDALGVCGGGCPADIDGDGICDDEDDCLYDFNNNGVCDDAEVPGCTYDDAVNYNENATVDDGSCEMGTGGSDNVWATCYGDLNADGLVQLNDLLGLLTVYGNDCE